jgi:hypothetical protein
MYSKYARFAVFVFAAAMPTTAEIITWNFTGSGAAQVMFDEIWEIPVTGRIRFDRAVPSTSSGEFSDGGSWASYALGRSALLEFVIQGITFSSHELTMSIYNDGPISCCDPENPPDTADRVYIYARAFSNPWPHLGPLLPDHVLEIYFEGEWIQSRGRQSPPLSTVALPTVLDIDSFRITSS